MATPTIESITQGLNDIKSRIATTGVQDASGKTLLAPTSPIPSATGSVEMNSDGSPAISPAISGVIAGGTGATTQGQSTIDSLQKKLDELAKQQPSTEVTQEKKSIMDLIKKREETVSNQKSAVELRQEALQQAYSEMGVTPEQIQTIGSLIGQVTSFNQQIADITVNKQKALDAIENRTGGTVNLMNAETNRVSKSFNSEIAAVGVQAAVKAQELQMIQGAYSDAKATSSDIVNLATHDQQQEVADIEWSLNAHQDLYNLMSKEEQDQWNKQYTMAKNELDTAKSTLTDRSKYVINPETADAFKGQDWTKMTDEDFTNTLASYTSSSAYIQKQQQLTMAGSVSGGAGYADTPLNQLRELQIQQLTQTVPGQIVSAATGQSVKLDKATNDLFEGYGNYIDNYLPRVETLLQSVGTGGLTGRYMKTVQNLPLVQRTLNNEQNALLATMASMNNQLVYLLSGKQINEQEYQRLKDQMPDVTLTNQQNAVRISEFKKTLESAKQRNMTQRGLTTMGSTSTQSGGTGSSYDDYLNAIK